MWYQILERRSSQQLRNEDLQIDQEDVYLDFDPILSGWSVAGDDIDLHAGAAQCTVFAADTAGTPE
jgi:hypothetical protein